MDEKFFFLTIALTFFVSCWGMRPSNHPAPIEFNKNYLIEQYMRNAVEAEYSLHREDWPKAYQWYFKAAELDYVQASVSIAELFLKGRGVPRNSQEAMSWYKRATRLGSKEGLAGFESLACSLRDPQAMFELGLIYLLSNREVISSNSHKAFYWLGHAVLYGNDRAWYYLGYIYETGQSGVAQDKTKAISFYQKSIQSDISEGMKELARQRIQALLAETSCMDNKK